MNGDARLLYLQRMGIDVWQPRQPSATAPDVMAVADRPAAANAMDGLPAASAPAGRAEASAGRDPWLELQHEVAACRACGLCETRTQTVFGVGNRQTGWLLVGEAPGQDEDLQGEPFVGKAGQLLNEMLRAIGLERREVYIANMLKCRPPRNRDPHVDEIAACNGFLARQIELLRPKLIVAVGRIAAQNLLQTQAPLAKLRGRRHQLHNTPLVVVHHPAYLLRSPLEKAKAWEDLQFAVSIYNTINNNDVEAV